MADEPTLDMNKLLDELAELEHLPPALAGKRVDILRLKAWERLVEKGVVEEVRDVDFLGREVIKKGTRRVYRTETGAYEIWLEMPVPGVKGGGNVDVVVWRLEKDGDQVVKATGVGMDAHSHGPGGLGTSAHKAHFEKKAGFMERWKKLAEESGIEVETTFDKTDQFWWRQRLDELKHLEKEAEKDALSKAAKRYLTRQSPLAKLFKAIGTELTIADTGLALVRFELALYESKLFVMLRAALERHDYDAAVRVIDGATDTTTGGRRAYGSELYQELLEAFPLLGVGAMSETVWGELMERLRKMIRAAQKAHREDGGEGRPH